MRFTRFLPVQQNLCHRLNPMRLTAVCAAFGLMPLGGVFVLFDEPVLAPATARLIAICFIALIGIIFLLLWVLKEVIAYEYFVVPSADHLADASYWIRTQSGLIPAPEGTYWFSMKQRLIFIKPQMQLHLSAGSMPVSAIFEFRERPVTREAVQALVDWVEAIPADVAYAALVERVNATRRASLPFVGSTRWSDMVKASILDSDERDEEVASQSPFST